MLGENGGGKEGMGGEAGFANGVAFLSGWEGVYCSMRLNQEFVPLLFDLAGVSHLDAFLRIHQVRSLLHQDMG